MEKVKFEHISTKIIKKFSAFSTFWSHTQLDEKKTIGSDEKCTDLVKF